MRTPWRPRSTGAWLTARSAWERSASTAASGRSSPTPASATISRSSIPTVSSGTLLATIGARARRGRLRLSLHPDQFVVPRLRPAARRAPRPRRARVPGAPRRARRCRAAHHPRRWRGRRARKPPSVRLALRARSPVPLAGPRLVAIENDEVVYGVEDFLPLCHVGLGAPRLRRAPPSLPSRRAHHHRGHRRRRAHLATTRAVGAPVEPPRRLAQRHAAGARRLHRAIGFSARVVGARRMTVDVEAKAKELAVLRLGRWLARAQQRRA